MYVCVPWVHVCMCVYMCACLSAGVCCCEHYDPHPVSEYVDHALSAIAHMHMYVFARQVKSAACAASLWLPWSGASKLKIAQLVLYQARKHFVYCVCGARGVSMYVCVREREKERERERERDGSDVTKVVLKFALSSHFPLPRIRTFCFAFSNGDDWCPCPTRSCSSFLFSQMVIVVALKLAMSSHFLLPKNLHSSFGRGLSYIARQVIEEPTTNDWIRASPSFF